MSKNTVKLDSF